MGKPPSYQQESTFRCAQCGADNYAFASFCISCGEPLDAAGGDNYAPPEALHSVAPSAIEGDSLTPNTQHPTPSTRLRHKLARRETVLGLLLLALTLGYAIYAAQQNAAQSAAYREGLAAEQSR